MTISHSPFLCARVVAFGVVACATLIGCAERTMSALTVTVFDGDSNAPIEGAKVVADTPSFKHPFSISAAILHQDEGESVSALTDEQGCALVEYLAGHPVRIGVLARGHPMLIENIDEPWLGQFELRTRSGEPGAPIRVRVQPGTSRLSNPASDRK